MIVAKKRFGQNFLTDPKKAERLVGTLEISVGDPVIEIGAGTGILTERLLDQGADLVAVEIDRDLAKVLLERFGDNRRFKLVEDDIINVNPAVLKSKRFKVIGNLPYNISGAVVEWLIDYFDFIGLAVITVQKEVADRLRAAPGNRDYGSLTVLAQSFYDIRREFDIPPGCFSPKPRVMSTVLKLAPNRKLDSLIRFSDFRDFVRACFASKRKKLTNSLASSLGGDKYEIEKTLSALGLGKASRAEELSLEDFFGLYGMMVR